MKFYYMLNISKNQLVPGQQVVVNLTNIKQDGWDYIRDSFQKYYKTGDILTLDRISGTEVYFKDASGKEQSFWWSELKKFCELPASVENLGKENVEYVIFYNGKKYKAKKFKDAGKVKASLLVMMSYHDKFAKASRKFLANCPELEYIQTPEWLEYGDNMDREDFEKVEIFEWANRKLGKKVEDFSPVDFYDEQMLLIKVSSRFGSAARDLFKKVKDTHKYMFVFMHEDYKNKYPNYEYLKESEIIKNVLKSLKLKGTYKSTKVGKTAIALNNSTEVIKIVNSLPVGSKYLILDMRGDELEKRDEGLFIMESREEILNELFKED